MVNLITDYEKGRAGEEDLYSILVDIQNTWEVIITKQDLV